MQLEKKFETGKISPSSIQDYIAEAVENSSLPPASAARINICADEIISNILKYSGAGEVNVKIDFSDNRSSVSIAFADDGIPFNPLEDARKFDASTPLDQRGEGGMGVFIVRKMMKSVNYSRQDNLNIFRICT